MNYNILKKLICNLETITADKQTTRDYLLNIIYHHSWFYLTNTDDPQKFKEIMDWWKQNESDKTYYNLLRGEFSTEPSARERRKSQKKWLKSNILHWYEW